MGDRNSEHERSAARRGAVRRVKHMPHDVPHTYEDALLQLPGLEVAGAAMHTCKVGRESLPGAGLDDPTRGDKLGRARDDADRPE